MNPEQVKFVAHRGESIDAPENTAAAFDLAWQRECSAIELDIYLTADGKIAVHHDGFLKNSKNEKVLVAESTYEELLKFDVGAFKGERFRDERIPLLPDILAAVPEGREVLVEIKCGAEIVPELTKCISASSLKKKQIIFICFDADVLEATAKAIPGHECLFLDAVKGDTTGKAEELIEMCITHNFDGVDLHFKQAPEKEFINKLHSAGLKVYTWTVDDEDTAAQQIAAGVDGITSNCAAKLAANFQ